MSRLPGLFEDFLGKYLQRNYHYSKEYKKLVPSPEIDFRVLFMVASFYNRLGFCFRAKYLRDPSSNIRGDGHHAPVMCSCPLNNGGVRNAIVFGMRNNFLVNVGGKRSRRYRFTWKAFDYMFGGVNGNETS